MHKGEQSFVSSFQVLLVSDSLNIFVILFINSRYCFLKKIIIQDKNTLMGQGRQCNRHQVGLDDQTLK